MITFRIGGFQLSVHWSFWLLLGLASAAPKQPVLPLGLLAAACHELGHFGAMLAVGMAPRNLRFSALGGKLQAKNFPGIWAELASVGAGGAVNLALAGLFAAANGYEARLFSAVNLVLGGLNLLPVQGLDGGRMVVLLLERRWEDRKSKAAAVWISAAVLVLLAVWCFLLWKSHPDLPALLLGPFGPAAAFWGWLRGRND